MNWRFFLGRCLKKHTKTSAAVGNENTPPPPPPLAKNPLQSGLTPYHKNWVSKAADMPVEFQSDAIIIGFHLAASTLYQIRRQVVRPLSE